MMMMMVYTSQVTKANIPKYAMTQYVAYTHTQTHTLQLERKKEREKKIMLHTLFSIVVISQL